MSRCVVSTYAGGNRLDLLFVPNSARRGAQEREHRSRRGTIRGFSRKSRRRLMLKLASVNRLAFDNMPMFCTLTYHERWDDHYKAWKDQVRTLLRRFRRRYGNHSVLWRLEYQKRGAPHFHLLIFDLRPSEGFAEWLATSWWEINGKESRDHLRYGTDAQRCDSWRRVGAYLSKYIAKLPDKETSSPPEHGRIWGFEDQSELPVSPVSYQIALREALALRRVMRKLKGSGGWRGSGLQTERCYLSEETFGRYRRALMQTSTLLDRGG